MSGFSETNSDNRFGIYVPSPESRLNMGKPEKGDSPFGYKGISLKTAENLFVDISKTTLAQMSAFYLQSGGNNDQFSSKVNIASTGDNLFAASGRVILAAGAGQGKFTQGSTGDAPRWFDYNNLDLHYRVDEVHTALKVFFYGKGTYGSEQEKKQSAQVDQFKGNYPSEGFLHDAADFLATLGFAVADHEALHEGLLQPLEWNGDRLGLKTGIPTPTSDFSPLVSFDPYASTGFKDGFQYGIAMIRQVATLFRRTSDVLQSLLPALTKFELIKRLQYGIAAVRSFLSFLDHFNPDDWQRYGGEVWAGSADRFMSQAKGDKYETGENEAAKLTSLTELFDISGHSPLTLSVYDVENGAVKTVDLSAYAGAQPAKLNIEVGAKFAKIKPSGTADGTLSLGGSDVAYTHQGSSWGSLPDGFGWDGGDIKKSEGGLFEASGSGGVTITDKTFSGAKARFNADGSNADHSLTSLNALSADDRASALATLLDGTGGCTATASGATVSIESSAEGPDAILELVGDDDDVKALGLDGTSKGTGPGQMTAAQLASELNGAGLTASASASGPTATLTHNTKGSDSYLEVEGALATVFFGSNPAKARGKSQNFFAGVSDISSILKQIDGWPGTIRDMAKPVYELFDDVGKFITDLESAAKNVQAFLTGSSLTKAIGLFAGGDGMTLSSKGGIYATGNNVTIVANAVDSGDASPDKKKYVPLLEPALAAVKKASDDITAWTKKLLEGEASKKKGLSGFRVVSGSDINLMSKGLTRITALGQVDILTTTIEATTQGRIRLSSREAAVHLEAATISIGLPADVGPQPKTDKVVISAADVGIQALSTTAGLWVDEENSKLRLGSRDGATTDHDESKPSLMVDFGNGQVIAGFVDGTNPIGLCVDDAGEVAVAAKGKVAISAGNTPGLEISSSGIKTGGKLDVGGVLSVQGNPLPGAPLVVGAMQSTYATKIAQVKSDHSKVLADLEVAKTALNALVVKENILVVAISGVMPQMLVGDPEAKTKLETQKAGTHLQVSMKKVDIRKLRQAWEKVVADAHDYLIEEIITAEADNRARFEV